MLHALYSSLVGIVAALAGVTAPSVPLTAILGFSISLSSSTGSVMALAGFVVALALTIPLMALLAIIASLGPFLSVSAVPGSPTPAAAITFGFALRSPAAFGARSVALIWAWVSLQTQPEKPVLLLILLVVFLPKVVVDNPATPSWISSEPFLANVSDEEGNILSIPLPVLFYDPRQIGICL